MHGSTRHQVVLGMDLEKAEVRLTCQDGGTMSGLEAHTGPWGQTGVVPGPGSARRRP